MIKIFILKNIFKQIKIQIRKKSKNLKKENEKKIIKHNQNEVHKCMILTLCMIKNV